MKSKLTEQLSSAQLKQFDYVYQKSRKFACFWGILLIAVFVFSVFYIFILCTYFHRASCLDKFLHLFILIIFLGLLNLIFKYFKFFYTNYKNLKSDRETSSKNVESGILESYSISNNQLELKIDGQIIFLKFGVSFLGYKLEHFHTLTNQNIRICYLKNSHLLFEIEYTNADLKETHLDNRITGIVTYTVVHRINMKLNWIKHSMLDRKIQIGNELLFWFKEVMPEVGTFQDIQIK